MLVLSREINEDILIGDEIVVTVVDVRGPHVRLGIQAPWGISVDRREVREQKEAKKGQWEHRSRNTGKRWLRRVSN